MIGSDSTHYGMELIVDAHDCDPSLMTRKKIRAFLDLLITTLDVERAKPPFFWMEDTPIPHLQGLSCIQFIKTSNITIHTLDITHSMYMNIFSCKFFDRFAVEELVRCYFKTSKVTFRLRNRT